MSIRKNLILLNLYEAFRAMLFILPVVVIYYGTQKSVGIDGVFICESAYSLAIMLMIVPAGWLSDVWQRKYVLAIGSLVATCGFVVVWFGHGLWVMALGDFIVGIGYACASSSITAMAYDSLQAYGKEDEHLKVRSQLHLTHMVTTAVASIMGSWMYTVHADLPIAMVVIATICSALVAFLMVEPARIKERGEQHPIKDMFETVKYTIHGHKEVACIILLGVVVFTITRLGFWLHQPFYQAVNVPTEYFGILVAIGLGMGSLGTVLAYKLEPKLKPKVTVLLLIAIPIVTYGGAGVLANKLGLVLIALVGLIWGFGKPVLDHAINKRVSSRRRGTINSTKQMLISLAFIISGPFVGKLVAAEGAFVAMEIMALMLAVLGGISYLYLKRYKVI